MPPNVLLARDSIVDSLRHAVKDGQFGLSDVPGLLKKALKEEAWRERVIQQTGEIARFERFNQFVTTPPLEGLGATVDLLQKLCHDDKEALDLIDQAMAQGPGAPMGNQNASEDKTNVNIVNICFDRDSPVGNTASTALRRLRKSRPDLHAQVLGNKLSPHAAMVEAGFRKPTITVPLDPEPAARALKRHFSKEQLAEIVRLVTT